MSKEIDNIFIDVRNAFRLLNRYQKRVLHIVNYIREQTPYVDMWGSKGDFFSCIGNKRNSPDCDYAKLRVHKDMWGWDFLYGYIFEYYFGPIKFGRKTAEMSIFQISDDGFFISEHEKKHMTDVSSFSPADKSHSYLLLNISVFTTKYSQLWLKDPKFPDDSWKDFLSKFLSSSEIVRVINDDKGEVTILKKYEMQCFSTQQSADNVIRDFGKIVKENADIELFKADFYSRQ